MAGEESTRFVLVPGAWHGGWAWHPVAQRLRRSGHACTCLTLPGTADGERRSAVDLASAVRYVAAAIESHGHEKVALVAHSLGGIVAAGVAAHVPTRIERLIFFSAFVPLPGESMNDANPPEYAAMVRESVATSADGTITIPFEAFRTVVMQDQPEAAQRLVHNLLTPAPGRYFLDPYDGPELTTLGIPITYVLAEDDRALARPGRELAARLGVEPVLVPGSHEALLTHPDDVAHALHTA